MTIYGDPAFNRLVGMCLARVDGIIEAPDHGRAKIAAKRFRQALEYALHHGDVPPEGWQPKPDYPPLNAYLESHHSGIAGEGVETETWKGLTPDA